MPELPEAETIKNSLARVMTGRKIESVEVFTPAMREPLTPLLSAGLTGRTIVDFYRRGRYVVAVLDDGRGLLMHFGMSGVVRVEPLQTVRRKHEHVFLHLSGNLVFKFECTRRFSVLKVVPDAYNVADFADFGVEPLSDGFNPGYLYQLSRRRHCPVKSLIMDNYAVTGVGNIYAAESLFAAKIHPLRRADSLTHKECERLCREIKRILTQAIVYGGTSVSDFLDVDGSEGKFTQELKVYGQSKAPCPGCGSTIQNVRIGGRSSFFCPVCQKEKK